MPELLSGLASWTFRGVSNRQEDTRMANAHRLNQWEEIAKARSSIALEMRPWWKAITWKTAFQFVVMCVIWGFLMLLGATIRR